MVNPSGEQYDLVLGGQSATITEVGATLRGYRVAGREVVDGFAVGEIADGGRGQVLAPWPNRLEDGTYVFEGISGQAGLDEPDRHNAIHGLVRWLAWQATERSETSVTLSCPLAPQPAYPFELGLTLTYSLGTAGLSVVAEARCEGERPLPFGIGFHPYLSAPAGEVDSSSARIPAATRLLFDERGLPTGREDVAGTGYDFRETHQIGGLQLDDCYTALDRGADGLAVVDIGDASGDPAVALWVDASFPYLMCFSGDTLGDASARRRALAVEPMSCAPNALRTGDGLVTLEPGSSWRGSWGIRPASLGAG